MIFVPEKDVKRVVKRFDLPVLKNPCPADGNTERAAVKQLVHEIDAEYKGIRERVFGAIERSNLDGWEKPAEKKDK